MEGHIYVFRDGQGRWIPKEEYRPKAAGWHYIQMDTMDPLMNHSDGRMYDSKSAFRAATKAAGCVEIGNDIRPETVRRNGYEPQGVKSSIIDAYRRHVKP